jgi:hypothetical protein
VFGCGNAVAVMPGDDTSQWTQMAEGEKVLQTALFAGTIGGAAVFRALKSISLPGWSKVTVDMAHIAERHMVGGALTAGRDVFVGMGKRGVLAAIRQAYGSAGVVSVQSERLLLSGVTKTGMTVEMWFNRATNMIETAYPVGSVR